MIHHPGKGTVVRPGIPVRTLSRLSQRLIGMPILQRAQGMDREGVAPYAPVWFPRPARPRHLACRMLGAVVFYTIGGTQSGIMPAKWPKWRETHQHMATPMESGLTTHTLETGEATIVYDVQGPLPTAGGRPPLFMIGQPMDANGFRTLA